MNPQRRDLTDVARLLNEEIRQLILKSRLARALHVSWTPIGSWGLELFHRAEPAQDDEDLEIFAQAMDAMPADCRMRQQRRRLSPLPSPGRVSEPVAYRPRQAERERHGSRGASECAVMDGVRIEGQDVVIRVPKAVLVFTKDELKAAIIRGKRYQRRKERAQRIPTVEESCREKRRTRSTRAVVDS